MFPKSTIVPIMALTMLVAPASTADAQQAAASELAGKWTGSFAQTDWTFEFKQEGGTWSGRYMSARNGKWFPMQSLAVSGRAVRFGLDAKPPLTFDLELDRANKALAGNVKIFGQIMPFSATRNA